jgi:SnoaL-like domain
MTVARKHADQTQLDLIEGLFEALIGDGFTAACCGPKDDPIAVIAFYEWRDHLDVITLPREGPAAAARLIKSADVRDPLDGDSLVLNPPDTAIWSWVGQPEWAIQAALDLPHPDDPDAPAAVVPTPAALRVPQEQRRPMYLRVPDEGKAGAREARLSRRPARSMSEQFFNDLLDEVDRESAIGFADMFVEDGTFVWANFPKEVGRTAITKFTQGFFSMVARVSHSLENYWRVGEQHAMTNGRVTFTVDDTNVTVPFCTVSHFTPDGTQLTYYQVYMDPSPLFQLQPQR